MSKDFQEFQGSSLDDAIKEACSFFDLPREKLEVEILQDAKSGIFGLVGVKKAKIRAKKTELLAPALSSAKPRKEESKHSNSPRPDNSKDLKSKEKKYEKRPKQAEHSDNNSEEKPKREAKRPFKDQHDTDGTEKKHHSSHNNSHSFVKKDNDMEIESEGMPNIPLTELDQDKLYDAAHSVMQKLTTPIVGTAEFSFEIEDDRLKISIACDEAPGLLIGRDGQTLASLQYLSSRILSMRLSSCVRVQIDAGDYRERQDERIKEITLMLAEKVRTTGHAQYTRPLSSYHRRLVHLALQTETDLITRSKGDGPLKRVAIIKKRT